MLEDESIIYAQSQLPTKDLQAVEVDEKQVGVSSKPAADQKNFSKDLVMIQNSMERLSLTDDTKASSSSEMFSTTNPTPQTTEKPSCRY